MSRRPFIPVTAADYGEIARRRLPRFLADYIDGGAGEEITVSRNVEALRRISLRQRVMRDVSAIDTGTTVLGQSVSMPLVLGPVALAGMYRRRGEVQAARAAVRGGVTFTTSTMGICSPEEVQSATSGASWFQLYMLRDRVLVQALLATLAVGSAAVAAFWSRIKRFLVGRRGARPPVDRSKYDAPRS